MLVHGSEQSGCPKPLFPPSGRSLSHPPGSKSSSFPRRRSLPRARLDLGRVLVVAHRLIRFRSARQCLGLRQRSCPRPPRLAWSPPLYRSLVLLVQRRELAELVRRPQLASVIGHWRNWAVVRPCGRPIDGRQLPDKWAIVQSAGGRMSVSVHIS